MAVGERSAAPASGGLRTGLRILGGALRWRATTTVALLIVAIVAVAGSAVGPAFERSGDDSAFTTAVIDAAPESTLVSVVANGGPSAVSGVAGIDAGISRLGRKGWFGPPVTTAVIGASWFQSQQRQGYSVDLLARTGLCAHVRLVVGSCPTQTGQAALSARSAQAADVHPDQTLAVTPTHGTRPVSVVVTGVYDPPTDLDTNYWDDNDYFRFGTSASSETALDPLLTTTATVLEATGAGASPQISSSQHLLAGTLYPSGFGTFERALRMSFAATAARGGITPSTGLFSFLAGVTHDDDVAGTVVEAIVLQLVLLALLVLYSLVALTGADRTLEIEIARRRGFTRPSLLTVATGEVVTLLLVALPIGLAVAAAVIAAVGHALFVAGTPVGLDGPSLLAAVVAFAGGLAAAVVGSWGLWHGAPRQTDRAARGRSASAAVDAFAVALAAAGLIGLSTQGSLGGSHTDPIVALAPGLLAVGAGVIGLRLAALVVLGTVRASGQSRRVALFLAVREVARRRPPPLRQLLAVSVSVVLIVFAVTSWARAEANRNAVARFQVGAERVLEVRVAPGVDFESAVRSADPSGKEAMAAAVYDSADGRLLAVDAARFAAVATWPTALTGMSAQHLVRYLAPTVSPPLEVTGSALRLTVTLPPGAPSTTLSATLINNASQTQIGADFGTLHTGSASYTASLGGACTSTCRLAGLTPSAPDAPDSAASTSLMIDGVAVQGGHTGWRALPFGSGRTASWTASPTAVTVTTRPGSSGVSFSIPDLYLGGQGIVLAPTDAPSPVPAVVTDDLAADDDPTPPDDAQSVTGLDGASLAVAGEVEAPTLPGIGADAAMVDLTFAQLAQRGPSEASSQVWLARPPSPGLLARLRARGVTVASTATAGARASVLARSPLALVYRFVLGAAPVAALLGIGAAVVALLASGRRRRADLRALRAVGLGRAVVIRAALIETGIVLGAAWVVGAIAGIVAARLALESLPQFTDGTGGIPISHSVPTVALVATLAGLAGLFVLTAAAAMLAVFGWRRVEDNDRSTA